MSMPLMMHLAMTMQTINSFLMRMEILVQDIRLVNKITFKIYLIKDH